MAGPRATGSDKGIGRRLKESREALGMRTQAVADSLGITRTAYLKWEGGETRLTLARLERVAAILRVPVRQLFYGRSAQDVVGESSSDGVPKAANNEKADRRESAKRLVYLEEHIKALAEMAEGYPLLRHLLSMAAMETRETLAKELAKPSGR